MPETEYRVCPCGRPIYPIPAPDDYEACIEDVRAEIEDVLGVSASHEQTRAILHPMLLTCFGSEARDA